MNDEIYHPNRDDYNMCLMIEIEEKINEINELKEKLKESIEKAL